MSDKYTKPPKQIYDPEQLILPKKKATNGRGVGLWLLSWGVILFAFAAYCGLNGGTMWAFRIAGLLLLLLGSGCFGMSFERAKE